ncbi:glycerol-3-phosphate acyltransferase PlsY [Escherichia coli]|nr:glycerol-3-phosphate acyltransferase PlsY [Escherichia coli]
MSAIAPGMILIAYLCGSISSAILVAACVGCPIREPAAPAIQAQPMCYVSVARSSRSSTDFRRSERNVARLGRV